MSTVSSPARHVEVARMMGTVVSVHVMGDPDPEVFADAADACFAHLRRADRVFSTYRDDSDVMRLRRGELAPQDADPWVADVADACARWGKYGAVFSATKWYTPSCVRWPRASPWPKASRRSTRQSMG